MKKIFIILLIILLANVETTNSETIAKHEFNAATEIDYMDMASYYENCGDFKQALEYVLLVEKINPDNFEAKKKKEYFYSIIYPNKIIKKESSPIEPKGNASQAVPIKPSDNELASSKMNLDPIDFIPDKNKKDIAKNNKKEENKKLLNKSNKEGTISKGNTNSLSAQYAAEAMKYYKNQNIDSSLASYLKALEYDKNNSIILNNLGIIYLEKNDLVKSIEFFEKANLVEPNYISPLLHLSQIYKNQDDEEKQVAMLLKAIEIDENNYKAYYLLGNYYYSKKNYVLAFEYYQKSLNKNTTFLPAYFAISSSLYAQGDYSNSILVLEKARQLDNSPEILFAIAKGEIKLKNFKKAKYYLEEALLLDPEKMDYLLELAKINYYLCNYEKAIEQYQTLISEWNRADLFNDLGLCYFKNNELKKAIDYFQKAIIIEPKNYIYKHNLALCYKAMNKNKLYKETYNDIMNIKPQTANDYIDLSYIFMDAGELKKALDFLDEANRIYPNEKKIYLAKLHYYSAIQDVEAYNKIKVILEEKFNTY